MNLLKYTVKDCKDFLKNYKKDNGYLPSGEILFKNEKGKNIAQYISDGHSNGFLITPKTAKKFPKNNINGHMIIFDQEKL